MSLSGLQEYTKKLKEIINDIQNTPIYTSGEKFVATNYLYEIISMCENYLTTYKEVKEIVE